jgi:phenylacetate-CoA ligase
VKTLLGTARVLATALGDRRTPFLDPEQVYALRDRRVREIVRHAVESVPYYADLFRSLGAAPQDIRTAADLRRLPLLDKETVHADPARFLSTSPRARDAVRYVTTGTSGLKLTVWHDRRSLVENVAYGERQRAVEVRFAGARVRYTVLRFGTPGSTGARTRSAVGAAAWLPLRPSRENLQVTTPFDRLFAEIDRLRPDVIAGWGSFLELLFRTRVERGVHGHLPRVVSYGNDSMSPEGKELIEKGLGVPVISRYAAVESFRIGFTCEERSGLHLHDDLCHVRVVGPNGSDVPAGENGEVVLSNLVNHATVLLNYRLGDLAATEAEPCPCGRSLGRLAGVRGRASEILVLASGKLVHPYDVWAAVERVPGLVRYQLVELGEGRFRLSLVTADRAAFEPIAERAACALSALLEGARVEPVSVPLPEAGDVGKFTRVVRLR